MNVYVRLDMIYSVHMSINANIGLMWLSHDEIVVCCASTSLTTLHGGHHIGVTTMIYSNNSVN